MAPKRARRAAQVAQTAASTRPRRGRGDALVPTIDDINLVGTRRGRRRGLGGIGEDGSTRAGTPGRATAGTRRRWGVQSQGRQGSTGRASQSQQQQRRSGSTGEGAGATLTQQQQSEPNSENAAASSAQQQQRVRSTERTTDEGERRTSDHTAQGATQPPAETTTTTAEAGTTSARQSVSQTQQSTGEKGQDDSSEKSKDKEGESKRRRSSEGKKPESPKKKQKTNEGGQEDGMGNGSSQGTGAGSSAGPPQRSGGASLLPASCNRLAEYIREYERTPAPVPPAGTQWPDPVVHGEDLLDVDVYRAVSAVTEALSEQEAHLFSFIDWDSFNEAGFGNVRQTVARPGNEMLIPWITGGVGYGHHSLFFLRRNAESGQFEAIHLDSARMNGHRNTRGQQWNRIRQLLEITNWTGGQSDLAIPARSTPIQAITQQGPVECGRHVIFNAWALALGMVVNPNMTQARYDRFILDGEELIREAVYGNLSSQALREFFDCYGFANPGPETAARSFHQTVPLRSLEDLPARVARVRIEAALPVGVGWDDAVPVVAPLLPDQNWAQITTDDFLRMFQEQQAAIASAFTAGDPEEDDSGTQRALAESLSQAGRATTSGGTTTQSRARSGSAEGTTAGQSRASVNEDEAAAAARLQAEYDAGRGRVTTGPSHIRLSNTGILHQATGSLNAQNADLSWSGSTGAEGRFHTGTARTTDGVSSSNANASGTAPGQQSPLSTNNTSPPPIPATTQVLEGIPRYMDPSNDEHEEFTLERQAARAAQVEQARQHIETAQVLANGHVDTEPTVPPAPPPTAASHGPAGSGGHHGDEDEDEDSLWQDHPHFAGAGPEASTNAAMTGHVTTSRFSDEYDPPAEETQAGRPTPAPLQRTFVSDTHDAEGGTVHADGEDDDDSLFGGSFNPESEEKDEEVDDDTLGDDYREDECYEDDVIW